MTALQRYRVVSGTKTLKQLAEEMTAENPSPAPAQRDRAKVKLKRKRLPRAFDRREKSWTRQIRDMPVHTNADILKLRQDLSLSRADASRLLRVARNTIWDWETGYRAAPFSAFLALSLLTEKHSLRDVRQLACAPLSTPAPIIPTGGSRAQSAQLRERMETFVAIYNAAWALRHSWHGSALRRQEYAWRFANVLARELRKTLDFEALLYAIADSLYASPMGVPWESR